ncbi:MAG: PAS domain-containing sensor histidine kinase, partial [Acidobacteriota bacterium]
LDSFNLMTQELKTSKQKIEQSNIEQQQTTLELERRGSYIETLLENITAGIISLNKSGKLSTINPAAIKMLKLDGRKLIGVNYRKVFSATHLQEVRKIIKKVRQSHEPFLEIELTLSVEQRKSTFSFSFITLKDKEQKYLGLVIVLDELTELLQAQKMAAWRDVARRLAHEIKNPLTPIQLSAERIRKKYTKKGEHGKIIDECTRTIIQEANALKALVDEFSQFARMPEPKPVLCNLHHIIEDTLLLYEGNTKKIQIEKRFSPQLPQIMVAPEQMKRVFINLLDNAIEAMDESGKVVISSSYNPSSQRVQIIVSDQGHGINSDDKDKLFMPYFSTKPKGTGLGLSIVSKIISDHHGSVRVEENHPRGAKFIIELPLQG